MIRQKESAVSPVVGVMLMLVVTIIIAAVVSVFAGGISGGASKAPQASIGATAIMPAAGNQTIFEHKGGDAFDLNSIKISIQSQDTKTTLTTTDVGTNCIAFKKIGDSGNTMIKPGDKFTLVGEPGYANSLAYGHFSIQPNTKVSWTILDIASGQAIANGDFVV
jgi:FlaG/FlaF family flagellin (archaellin)